MPLPTPADELHQIIRALERERALHRSGRFRAFEESGDPRLESLKFRTHAGSAYPHHAVQSIGPAGDGRAWEVVVNAIGLFGFSGVLPLHYTELVQAQSRQDRGALRDFFDLLNHRITTQYFMAWQKYRLDVQLERSELRRRHSSVPIGLADAHRVVDGLIGVSGDRARSNNGALQASVRSLVTALATRRRTPEQLASALTAHFGLPTRIRQFVREIEPIDTASLTTLPGRGTRPPYNNRLGATTVLAHRAAHYQGKVQVIIGPVDYDAYAAMLPVDTGQPPHPAWNWSRLTRTIRFMIPFEMTFDVLVELRAEEFPGCRLELGQRPYRPILGYNTLLTRAGSADERIRVTLARSRSMHRWTQEEA